MTCSHQAADDFEIEDFPCPRCEYMGYVRFCTCSCSPEARGYCENCYGEIVLGRNRDDILSGEVWPEAS